VRISADLQQIWPEQSLLCLQVWAHFLLHRPLQHTSPIEVLHSEDWLQVLGQAVYVGFRQRPATPRLGSMLPTVVQQISPFAVLQSVDAAHALGHSDGDRQMGSL
jgi:hypothetical protein